MFFLMCGTFLRVRNGNKRTKIKEKKYILHEEIELDDEKFRQMKNVWDENLSMRNEKKMSKELGIRKLINYDVCLLDVLAS